MVQQDEAAHQRPQQVIARVNNFYYTALKYFDGCLDYITLPWKALREYFSEHAK
ncbi:MAG: hypothetical protein AAF944_22230 [Bacteroidota bacterium]